MFKVQPFFDSSLTEEYREFLNQPFQIGMVGLINHEQRGGVEPYFEGFRGTQMPSWVEYVNDDGFNISFYNDVYSIMNPNLKAHLKKVEFPTPKNLHEFICDCNRVALDLYWSNRVKDEIDLKYILSQEDYKEHIDYLLGILGKE